MAATVVTEVDRQLHDDGITRSVTYKAVRGGSDSAMSDLTVLEVAKRVEVTKNDGSRFDFTPNETHAANPKLVVSGESTTFNLGTLLAVSQTAYFKLVFGPVFPNID